MRLPQRHLPFMLVIAALAVACRQQPDVPTETADDETAGLPVSARFTLMPPEATGIDFSNDIREDYVYNNFNFEYMYNGGGVAAGDVNGDGLPDLYFSASLKPNRLYLNLGDFKFRDVTELAGVGAAEGFKTGVAMADINGDGRLDIYACRTSRKDAGLKTDYCYINMGNETRDGIEVPVFKEMNEVLGIADEGNTNHSCFFDYDRDGDLDLLLINHKLGAQQANKLRLQQQPDGSTVRLTDPETPHESNRLYRNDKGRFTDVTGQAGLVSSAYSLSATVADFNEDGWPDVYVANDYVEPDYLYINNRDGTFTDRIFAYLRHTSLHSMGCDIADINNDGLPDMATMEMRPEDPIRYKELVNMMQYDRYSLLLQHGYGPQEGWNMLQLNNGNQTFSEIGHFAGVSSTDWSWSVLLADLDQDGWKDIFITNGYRKDVTQLDYLNYFRDSIARTGTLTAQHYPDINEFVKFLPEKKLPNYLYLNNGRLGFRNVARQAGLDQPSFSNGAALADLDRDGDLDLVVNNINDPAFIYRNDVTGTSWLQIDPQDDGANRDAIGAEAEIFAGGMRQVQRLSLSRGFFSTSEPILHFGLGTVSRIDSIRFTWPDGKTEWLADVAANQRLAWTRGTGKVGAPKSRPASRALFGPVKGLAAWTHQEDPFVDFKRERLLPYMISAEGPCLATADINGDGLTDIYAGNGAGFASALLIQQADGQFKPAAQAAFDADKHFEDCGAVFGDLDGDGDADLVVVSGGNALSDGDPGYMVRDYRNDGAGGFSRNNAFPLIRTNAGAVHAVDYDGDNDLDLIIGGRATPGYFPKAPRSYLLRNDRGTFTDVTASVFPDLERIGMVTDIASGDLEGDGRFEIVIVGEWMPVRLFAFDGKVFKLHASSNGLARTEGLWRSVALEDLDGDGKPELLAGNIGLNTRWSASDKYPMTVVSSDFDENGSLDAITCFYHQGKLYPYPGRDAMISQLPVLKKKYIRYNPYARATIEEIVGASAFKKAEKHLVRTLRTSLFTLKDGQWTSVELPAETQWSPAMDLLVRDINGDGRKDILMAGNFSYAEPETGELDCGNGTLLIQQADGRFAFVPNREHGYWAIGEARQLAWLDTRDGGHAVATGNNAGRLEYAPLVRASK